MLLIDNHCARLILPALIICYTDAIPTNLDSEQTLGSLQDPYNPSINPVKPYQPLEDPHESISKDQESVSDPSEYKLTDDVALLEDSLSKLQQENEGLKQDSYKAPDTDKTLESTSNPEKYAPYLDLESNKPPNDAFKYIEKTSGSKETEGILSSEILKSSNLSSANLDELPIEELVSSLQQLESLDTPIAGKDKAKNEKENVYSSKDNRGIVKERGEKENERTLNKEREEEEKLTEDLKRTEEEIRREEDRYDTTENSIPVELCMENEEEHKNGDSWMCCDGCNKCKCVVGSIISTKRACSPYLNKCKTKINKNEINNSKSIETYSSTSESYNSEQEKRQGALNNYGNFTYHEENVNENSNSEEVHRGKNCIENGEQKEDGTSWDCCDGCNRCKCADGRIISTERACFANLDKCKTKRNQNETINYISTESYTPTSERYSPDKIKTTYAPTTEEVQLSKDCIENGEVKEDGSSWDCCDGCNSCSCKDGLIVSTKQFCPPRLGRCNKKVSDAQEIPTTLPTGNPYTVDAEKKEVPESEKLFDEISHMESDIAESLGAKPVNITKVIDQYQNATNSPIPVQNKEGEYRQPIQPNLQQTDVYPHKNQKDLFAEINNMLENINKEHEKNMESIKNTNAYSELENQINSLTKQRVNEPEVYDPSNMTIQLTAAEEHSSKLDQENSSETPDKLLVDISTDDVQDVDNDGHTYHLHLKQRLLKELGDSGKNYVIHIKIPEKYDFNNNKNIYHFNFPPILRNTPNSEDNQTYPPVGPVEAKQYPHGSPSQVKQYPPTGPAETKQYPPPGPGEEKQTLSAGSGEVKEYPPAGPGDLQQYPPAGSAEVKEYSPTGPGEIKQYSPAGPAEVKKYSPAGPGEVKEYPPAGPAEVKEYPPAGPSDVQQYPPAGSAEVSQYSPADPGEVNQYPPAGPAKVKEYSSAGPGEVKKYPPAGPDEVKQYPPAGPAEVKEYSPAGPVEVKQYLPAAPGEFKEYPPAGPSEVKEYPPAGPAEVKEYSPAGPGEVKHYLPAGLGEVKEYPPAGPSKVKEYPLAGPSEVKEYPPAGPGEVKEYMPAGPSEVKEYPPTGPGKVKEYPSAGPGEVKEYPPTGPGEVKEYPSAGPGEVKEYPPTEPGEVKEYPSAGPDEVKEYQPTGPGEVKKYPVAGPGEVKYYPPAGSGEVKEYPSAGPDKVKQYPPAGPDEKKEYPPTGTAKNKEHSSAGPGEVNEYPLIGSDEEKRYPTVGPNDNRKYPPIPDLQIEATLPPSTPALVPVDLGKPPSEYQGSPSPPPVNPSISYTVPSAA